MSTILDKIKAYKLEEVAARKAARPLAGVEAAAPHGGTIARTVARSPTVRVNDGALSCRRRPRRQPRFA